MKLAKRKHRGYKITDDNYFLAMKQAKKEKNPLSKQIEDFVISIANKYRK